MTGGGVELLYPLELGSIGEFTVFYLIISFDNISIEFCLMDFIVF
jgi:hypothetical protein